MTHQNSRHLLSEHDTDAVAQAVLTLTHELWVVTDRLAMVEALLEKNGINITEEIETIRPSEAQQQALNARGKALVEAVTNALAGVQAD